VFWQKFNRHEIDGVGPNSGDQTFGAVGNHSAQEDVGNRYREPRPIANIGPEQAAKDECDRQEVGEDFAHLDELVQVPRDFQRAKPVGELDVPR
jgi:hypothetical protein